MSLLDTASLLLTPNAYKEGKLYSVIPSDGSGDFTFTRATTATRVNSAGLVELVPYNLFQYSEQFDNAAWTKDLSSITYNQPDPFGGNNAALCTFTNLATSRIAQSLSIVAGNTYTLSAWIKGVNITDFRFLLGTNQVVLVASQIVNGEWVRVSATVTATTTGTYQQSPARSNNTNGESFYIYGAQLVEGTEAKDYYPTETRLNIPRLDYSLGSCPSILVEPQRTNLALQSSSFDNASWLKDGTVTANTTISPSGMQDADTWTTVGATNVMFQNVAVTQNTAYVFSFYVKRGTLSDLRYFIYNNSGGSNIVAATSYYSQTSTTEWVRILVPFTTPSGCTSVRIYPHLGTAGITPGTVFFWGAQLEAGSYATSYIPTTTASVTRNADVISKTGISSLIGQTEGTLFAEVQLNVKPENGSPIVGILCTNNNVADFQNCIILGVERSAAGTNKIYSLVQFSNITQAELFSPNITSGNYKIALAYKANDFALYVNGVQVATDTSGSVPTTSQVLIGQRRNSDNFTLADNINATALWQTRLTNTQLAALTAI